MVIIINTFRSLFSVHNCTAHINKYSSVIDYSPAVIIITYNISVPFLTWCMVHGAWYMYRGTTGDTPGGAVEGFNAFTGRQWQ